MKTGTRATLVTLLAVSFLTSGGKSDSTQRSEAAQPPREVLPPIPSPTAAPKTTAAENAASVDPAAAQYLRQGIAQFKAGNIDGAIASYTSGIRLAPGLATLYFNRAFAYQFQSDFNAVIADATKALELKIDKADEAYDMRGAALTRLGTYRAAIADCNRALSVNPNYAIAYANRANNEIRLQDLDGALADCNKSIALNPSSSLPYYTRGYVYAYKGEASKAIADWEKAMQMQPAFRAELEPRVRKLGGRP
jgi:tetratricopeptide (TPR) repeat protein